MTGRVQILVDLVPSPAAVVTSAGALHGISF